MSSANEDHLFVPRIERFDPPFCNKGVIFKIDRQSFPPLGNPGVDNEFESNEVIGVDHDVTTVGPKWRYGWTDGDFTVSRVSHTVTVDGKS